MISKSFLILNNSCLSSIVTAFKPIEVAYTQIVSFFFLITKMLAKYKLLFGHIIFYSNINWIFCFIFFYISESKVFGLAVIGNKYTRCNLCLRILVFSKLLL